MERRTLWLSFLGAVLFLACLPVKYSLDELPAEQLYFGSGGGFTGATREFLLLRNGQVFRFENGVNKKDTFELEPLSRMDARDVFHRLDTLRLHNYNFAFPGNMRNFIRETDAQTDYIIQWGDPRYEVREDVAQFFQDLNALMDNRRVILDLKAEKPGAKKEKDPW
ncbi:MAG: hypothetical protein H6563_12835 [Lewinellaceae bacterium]|nr:hypothetical protein [Lewinellaceae bacterium]